MRKSRGRGWCRKGNRFVSEHFNQPSIILPENIGVLHVQIIYFLAFSFQLWVDLKEQQQQQKKSQTV